MVKRNLIISILVFSASVCFATGWHDYTLDIGDGFNVFRANSMDVCIEKTGKGLILYPQKYQNVGPVIRYITTPTHILTKNLGRTTRNHFDGDTFQEIDPAQEFFFVISKGTNEVIGPLSESEFFKRPEVASISSLVWQIPKNPNFWLPFLGTLMFLAFSIPVLAIQYFWVTIPVVIGVGMLIRKIMKKNKVK